MSNPPPPQPRPPTGPMRPSNIAPRNNMQATNAPPNQPAQHPAAANRPAPASAPDTQATILFLNRHALRDPNISIEEQCPICLDNYSDDECVRIAGIPGCNHHIGLACLRDLLNRDPYMEKRCPICRALWIVRPILSRTTAARPAAARPATPRTTVPRQTAPRPMNPRPTPPPPPPQAPAPTAADPMGRVDLQGILNGVLGGMGNRPGPSGNNSMPGINGTPMGGLGGLQEILNRALGPLSGLSELSKMSGANGQPADPNNPTGGVDVQAIVNKALSGLGELSGLSNMMGDGGMPGMNSMPGMNRGAAPPASQPPNAYQPAGRRAGQTPEPSLRQQMDATRNRANRHAAAASAARDNYAAEARNFDNFNRDIENVRERARGTSYSGLRGRRGRMHANDNAGRGAGPTNRYLDSLRNPNGGYAPNTGPPPPGTDLRAIQAETDRLRSLFGGNPNINDANAGAQQPSFNAPPTRRPAPRPQLPLPNRDPMGYPPPTPPPAYTARYTPSHPNSNTAPPQFNDREAALHARELALARREAELSLRDTDLSRRESQMRRPVQPGASVGNGPEVQMGGMETMGNPEQMSEEQRRVWDSVGRDSEF